MTVYKGQLMNGQAVSVGVEGKKVEFINKIEMDSSLPLIAPPLVDLQNNGGNGVSFNNIHENPEHLNKFFDFAKSHGVGQVYLTLTTPPVDQMLKTTKALGSLLRENPDLERHVPGIFFEGIFMSKKEGWRGSHNPDNILDPDFDLLSRFNDNLDGRIKIVNVAPEEKGGMEFISKAVDAGIRVSLGHANPSADQVKEAVERGATMVTHFGNGATPQIHRHRNPLWSYLAYDELELGLILDGHHLPKDLIRSVFLAKNKHKINIVSDASSISGCPAGDYGEGGRCVIEKDGYLHLKGQEILAGAWHQMDRCVELLCEMGWSLSDAWYQGCVIPAKNMNVQIPEIKVGLPADFVISSYDSNKGLIIDTILIDGVESKILPVNPQ